MHVDAPPPPPPAVNNFIRGYGEGYTLSPEQREFWERLEPNGLYIVAEKVSEPSLPCLWGLAWSGGTQPEDVRVMSLKNTPPIPGYSTETVWNYQIKSPAGFDKNIVSALKVAELSTIQFSQLRDRLCFLYSRPEHPENYHRTVTEWIIDVVGQISRENIIQLDPEFLENPLGEFGVAIEAQQLGELANGHRNYPPQYIVRRSDAVLFPADYEHRPFNIIGGFVHGRSVIMGPPPTNRRLISRPRA